MSTLSDNARHRGTDSGTGVHLQPRCEVSPHGRQRAGHRTFHFEPVNEFRAPAFSWKAIHSASHGRCQTSKNEDSCRKHADDSPARCSPRHFAKFIHCEHLAGVIGMFSLDTVLESRYVVRKTGGSVAVHFISTVATR